MDKPSEYIIILHEDVSPKYTEYLIKRIGDTGLSVQLVSYDTLDFIKIYTSKQWLINYLSTEEHMEQYLSFDVKLNKDQEFKTKQIEEFQRLPKSAILAQSLLSHIIATTIQNINIDDQIMQMLSLHLVPTDKLITICKKHNIIRDMFPMSYIEDVNISLNQNKMKKWKLFFNYNMDNTNNLHKIRDYYGEEIGFYFGFMEHYTKWLIIPGLIGLIFFLTRSQSFDIDESKYIPFFALFVCIWSHFMIKFWNRRASELALQWNTIDFAEQKYLIQSDVRPEFRGSIRKSPVTDHKERYYPSYKRYPKFIVGLLITLLMLSLVFIMMICSLNLQGYISTQQSVIYIEYFNSLSKSDALFDADSNIMWIVPTLIHCCFVFFLNSQYSKVAEALTEWENWKFESDFENSLILKRFLFEFLDSFLPLFYICFYEMKMEVLTQELLSLFLCDEIRRISTESVLPLVMHLWELKQIKEHETNNVEEGYNVLIESRLDKYALFDDYLEMITQFGYITLFASCYPLAAVLSLMSNIFEVCSDSFKLCFLSQTPMVERAYNVHSTWIMILQFMAWFSILTNCYIFAFSSQQMEEWFPFLFNVDDKDEEIKTGQGRYVVFIMFAFEHLIGLLCLIIHYLVPNTTDNVDIQLQRKQHALYHEYIENINKKSGLLNQNGGTTSNTKET